MLCSHQGPDRMLQIVWREVGGSLVRAKIAGCWSPGVLLLDQISGHSITAQVKVGLQSAQTSGGVNTKFTHHQTPTRHRNINI